MADETRTDPSRGYAGNPEAHSYVHSRTPAERAAEQAKIEQLAADKLADVKAKAKPAAPTLLERRLNTLERTVNEHGIAINQRSPSVNLEAWINGVVTYVDVLTL